MLQLNNSLLSSINPSGSGEEKKTVDNEAMERLAAQPPMSDEQLRMEFERRVMTGKR